MLGAAGDGREAMSPFRYRSIPYRADAVAGWREAAKASDDAARAFASARETDPRSTLVEDVARHLWQSAAPGAATRWEEAGEAVKDHFRELAREVLGIVWASVREQMGVRE